MTSTKPGSDNAATLSREECRAIVLGLLQQHRALTRQELLAASRLGKLELARTVDGLCKLGVVRRRETKDGSNPRSGRYEWTGKTLPSVNRPAVVTPVHEACFAGLLAAWRIGLPKCNTRAYVSRVVRDGCQSPDGGYDIPQFTRANPSPRRLGAA